MSAPLCTFPARRLSVRPPHGASLPDARAEDDDDWDECEFEPGVHEVWDPGCLEDDDDSLPEAGDFWIDNDDEEARSAPPWRRAQRTRLAQDGEHP